MVVRTSSYLPLVSLLILACYTYPVFGLDNCPDSAVENELCDNGRGYCAPSSELPGGAKGQGSTNLKCFPGKPCGELPLQQNGFFKPVNISDITLGAHAELLCCDGYFTNTPVELACDVTQEWTGPNETCMPVDCGSVPPTAMAFVYIQASTFPNFAVLECGVGYEPLDDSVVASVATCGANGQWHTMLTCVVLTDACWRGSQCEGCQDGWKGNINGEDVCCANCENSGLNMSPNSCTCLHNGSGESMWKPGYPK